jgi:hypothetical protein
MTAYYEPLFLEDALHFLEKLPMNDAEKILYTIRKAQVKMDADEEILNANKYFRIFKLALDTKIPRLTE